LGCPSKLQKLQPTSPGTKTWKKIKTKKQQKKQNNTLQNNKKKAAAAGACCRRGTAAAGAPCNFWSFFA